MTIMEHRTSRHRRSTSSLSFVLALAILLSFACERETYRRPSGPGSWVLVDLIHSRKQNPLEHRLGPGVYKYQGVHGYTRLFEHLSRNGYPWTAAKKGRLTEERLHGFSVVFINLVSDDRPDFLPSEIEVLQNFVKAGGGLMVIADHTNVYRHGERLNRLLVPMGVEVLPHTAVDKGGHSVSGDGWIALRNLASHPTNDGIRMVSFQTGGVLKTECGTAFLSDKGYADFWNEKDTEGFYGNWNYDGDPKLEPKGAQPTIAACTFGKGRLAVVADQNIYGDTWIQYGDNFAHASNVFEWLAGRDNDRPRLREKPKPGFHMGVDTFWSRNNAGKASLAAYYGFFVQANRRPDARLWAGPELVPEHSVHFIPPVPKAVPESEIERMRTWVNEGGRLVIMLDVSRAPRGSVQLLQAFAPALTWSAGKAEENLTGTTSEAARRWQRARVPRIAKAMSIRVPVTVNTDCKQELFDPNRRYKVAALQSMEKQAQRPYLLKVQSTWGEPLFEVDGATLARRKRLGKGEVVVFVQDSFFWGRTLGKGETNRPPSEGEGALLLVDHLIDYIMTPLSCVY